MSIALPEFNTIGLIWKENNSDVDQTLSALIQYFLDRNKKLLAYEHYQGLPEKSLVEFDELANKAELIVTVGGDGTIIKSARRLSSFPGKLIGINQGHLGFLADIPPDDFANVLDQVLAGQYYIEERFLLDITVIRNNKSVFSATALNDAVVHKWQSIRMLSLETYVNGVFVHRYRSDGQIVATPTGSTAYALSAGGPILYPTLDALLLVPISPHRLSHRAITISSDSVVEIKVCSAEHDRAGITCDGQDDFELHLNDMVRIQKLPHGINILHPKDHNHFALLRDKLGWG